MKYIAYVKLNYFFANNLCLPIDCETYGRLFSVVYIRVLGEFLDARIENGIGC